MNNRYAVKRNYGPFYSLPMGIWFTIFFLAPLIIIVVYSFLKKGLYGGVLPELSLDAYRSLANPGFFLVTIRTLFIAVVSTLITIVIALPCAYYMARSKYQTFLLLLVIIPFWTNFLIRVFAWMNILGNNGFLNSLLMQLGLIEEFIPLLYNRGAVILVLVYMYLPYAILPLFSTIDKFDFSLLEAARDLGATKPEAIYKILFPNIQSGIYTAILFTFIPTFGAYAVPLMVGGHDSYMLGNIIADQLLRARNWPLSSAISLVLTVITTFGVMFMLTIQRRERGSKTDTKGIIETYENERLTARDGEV